MLCAVYQVVGTSLVSLGYKLLQVLITFEECVLRSREQRGFIKQNSRRVPDAPFW